MQPAVYAGLKVLPCLAYRAGANDHTQPGVKYSAGDQTSDLLDGYTCAFRTVNPLQYRETCTWTVWFYESDRFPALQLFWPDKQNRFPWEPDFDQQLQGRQPDLSQPPPSA